MQISFVTGPPDAKQVADPFHGCAWPTRPRRGRVNQTLGHRGHAHDPLAKLHSITVRGLLDAGDPYGEVYAKESEAS